MNRSRTATRSRASSSRTSPVICQHTRLDSRQAENALRSTIAYHE
ncbi:sensory rhodopsin transducer [Natronobacterium gregoryi]|nr:sensory rhodopsin transducer [Natronobacterium gregoryi]